jgi:hypothetical protein
MFEVLVASRQHRPRPKSRKYARECDSHHEEASAERAPMFAISSHLNKDVHQVRGAICNVGKDGQLKKEQHKID